MTNHQFREEEKVMYLSETGKLLGPFTFVGLHDDEAPFLLYAAPGHGKGPHYDGNHVHAIVGDQIVTVGWPKNGTIDPARIRRIH